ncbi:hypothetical protein FRAHR75_530034 [Frankia sp. Hr75.2]|nr:hypothetical protein FRAHR75_530034 [Frankia sp. Hr75.2]SQD94254.1 hypothetical protein FMEAI12_2420013 [Parafrankia sp. Ea1.12]
MPRSRPSRFAIGLRRADQLHRAPTGYTGMIGGPVAEPTLIDRIHWNCGTEHPYGGAVSSRRKRYLNPDVELLERIAHAHVAHP